MNETTFETLRKGDRVKHWFFGPQAIPIEWTETYSGKTHSIRMTSPYSGKPMRMKVIDEADVKALKLVSRAGDAE